VKNATVLMVRLVGARPHTPGLNQEAERMAIMLQDRVAAYQRNDLTDYVCGVNMSFKLFPD
jgi:hypothetical protein